MNIFEMGSIAFVIVVLSTIWAVISVGSGSGMKINLRLDEKHRKFSVLVTFLS